MVVKVAVFSTVYAMEEVEEVFTAKKASHTATPKSGQTELSSDQTIFERTHVLGALELHGLEKASIALLSGQ